MAKLLKQRSKKAGLPPGTPVHIGEERGKAPQVEVIRYDGDRFEREPSTGMPECIVPSQTPTVTWVNVDGLCQVELLQRLGHCFGIHPLVLEDIVNTDQRPKTEE